jgi:hypothetical protein
MPRPYPRPDRATADHEKVGESIVDSIINVSGQPGPTQKVLPRGNGLQQGGTSAGLDGQAPRPRIRASRLQVAADGAPIEDIVNRASRAAWEASQAAAHAQAVAAMTARYGNAVSDRDPNQYALAKRHAMRRGLAALDYPSREAAQHVAELMGVRNRAVPRHPQPLNPPIAEHVKEV